VTGGDVEATKPEPDLVEAGLRRAGGGPAVMIGDSTWDCRAAGRAGVPCVAVLTGGYSEQELTAAGAVAVHTSLAELIEAIAEPPLGTVTG
jgi:phosphoglycolate phosphatase-like HAD superfamily hydrolase